MMTTKTKATEWGITYSHLVNIPMYIEVADLNELREWLQSNADRHDLGRLTFRYELDSADRVDVIHSFFTNRKGRNHRFMRLKRS